MSRHDRGGADGVCVITQRDTAAAGPLELRPPRRGRCRRRRSGNGLDDTQPGGRPRPHDSVDRKTGDAEEVPELGLGSLPGAEEDQHVEVILITAGVRMARVPAGGDGHIRSSCQAIKGRDRVSRCYLCARNELLPMCPEWTKGVGSSGPPSLRREKTRGATARSSAGFEPATLRLTAVAARQRRRRAQKLGDTSPVVRS
jgi:hypothetical protein